MGIAALILGIVGLVIAWIPFCGILALIPCLVGLGLGIADIILIGDPKEVNEMAEQSAPHFSSLILGCLERL